MHGELVKACLNRHHMSQTWPQSCRVCSESLLLQFVPVSCSSVFVVIPNLRGTEQQNGIFWLRWHVYSCDIEVELSSFLLLFSSVSNLSRPTPGQWSQPNFLKKQESLQQHFSPDGLTFLLPCLLTNKPTGFRYHIPTFFKTNKVGKCSLLLVELMWYLYIQVHPAKYLKCLHQQCRECLKSSPFYRGIWFTTSSVRSECLNGSLCERSVHNSFIMDLFPYHSTPGSLTKGWEC